MKAFKLTLLTFACLILCNCEIRTKQAYASNEPIGIPEIEGVDQNGGYKNRIIETIDGIEYHIYCSGARDGGILVINHTKEQMEVEKLKKELNK